MWIKKRSNFKKEGATESDRTDNGVLESGRSLKRGI